MSDILRRLKPIVAETIGCDEHLIDDDATLESLGFDSLDIVEFLLGVEEEFNIDIPDKIAGTFVSLKGVADYVNEVM